LIKPFKFSIGSTELSIQNRYTLIKGRFKKNLVDNLKNDAFSELIKDLNIISMKKFIKAYLERSQSSGNLEKSLELLSILRDFDTSMNKNIEIVSQYAKILESLILLLRLNLLVKKEEMFQEELEITEEYKKISDLSASSDLVKKLNESLNKNKKKLKYLEEDYFQKKNQIDQIRFTIDDYKLQIKELTKKKKDYFSFINKITREMGGNSYLREQKVDKIFEFDINLTNSQKIKALQKKAKEAQIKINEFKSKIGESELKYNELNPIYETYENDYQKLKGLIETDEQRINKLDSKIKNEIKNKKNGFDKKLDTIDLKAIRSLQEIYNDIRKTSYDLKGISIPEDLVDPQNLEDLSLVITKLNEINDFLKDQRSKIVISKNEDILIEILDSFNNFENIIEDLELIINKFLAEINLKSSFRISLSDNNENFLIQIRFTRDNKEQIKYEELTTPEKIFFIIIFYLSIELHVENINIIFSNLFIPSKYNKAGSIFRTIRKIIPLFENEENLSKYNLIFVLSNLEMKKEIRSLNIITIQENE
jgi:hypothetical protein